MRELDGIPRSPSATEAPLPRWRSSARVGVGGSLAAAARRRRSRCVAGREDALAACRASGAALLCVPDDAIADAAAVASEGGPATRAGRHVSGATTLEALAPARAAGAETFSLHPLQTVPDPAAELTGSPCAIAGSTPGRSASRGTLVLRLGITPFEVAEGDRALYHAAACVASNFLVMLEESAGGAARGGGGAGRARAARPDRPPHGGELDRARPRGADRAGRARRPDHRRALAHDGCAPEQARRALRAGRGAEALGGGAAMKVARHERNYARRWSRPARKVVRSASCRRWGPCTRAMPALLDARRIAAGRWS